MNARVLLVDDDAAMADMLAARLKARGFTPTVCTRPHEAVAMAAHADLVVTDINMTGLSGLDLCKQLVATRPELPVLLMTAFGTLETAIQAIRLGAYDFLTKPFEIDQLALALERADRYAKLQGEVKRLRQVVHTTQSFDMLVGASAAMTKLFGLLEKVAQTDVPVLVTGESGTGKELVARALHRKGPRAAGPFVAINCAAVPEHLLESELFGHARGAFTDAREARRGLFLEAQGGTLFLDEIGDMPIGLQPKILRVLQERRVRPVGDSREVAFDARIVCATNRDLEAAVEEGRFRQDLYFRVNVLQLELPPLRARGSDVLLLAQRFLEDHGVKQGKALATLAPEAAERLLAYDWPGNVRELANCIERAVALSSHSQILATDLPEKVQRTSRRELVVGTADPTELITLEELEKKYIQRVLESVAQNKSAAARILGIERKTLYRMLDRWNAAAGAAASGGTGSGTGSPPG